MNRFLTGFLIFSIIKVLSGSELGVQKDVPQIYAPNMTPPIGTSSCSDQDNMAPDFMQGTLASFSVTLFSELGDKTFILAAILAMKQSRMQVFIGALAALAPMTVLSVVFGMAASIVPKIVLRTISSILLAVFGFTMLKESMAMSDKEGIQEFEKCKEDLNSSDNKDHKAGKFFAVTQAFTLTLLGELGDRSQIATILLATTENAYGVAVGGILGHMLCTAAAVLGGRLLAHNIPVKTMTTIGGMVFLVFAVTTWITG